jgi:hypothetical protein
MKWYCIDKIGMATLCHDEEDAKKTAADAQLQWPNSGPHRAVQLVEFVPTTEQMEPKAWFYRDNIGRPCSKTKEPLTPLKDLEPLYSGIGLAFSPMRRVGEVRHIVGTMRNAIWDSGMIPEAGSVIWVAK